MKTMCIETNPLSTSTPPHARALITAHVSSALLLCSPKQLAHPSPTPHPHLAHSSTTHRHPPSSTLTHTSTTHPQSLTLTHTSTTHPHPLSSTLTHSHPPSPHPHPTLTKPAPHRPGRDHRHNIPCQGHARVQLQRKGHDRRGRRQVCLRGWTLVWAGHSNNCPRALPPCGGAGVPVRGESLRFSTIITFSLYHGWENMYTDN